MKISDVLIELKRRNTLLYYSGLINIIGFIICIPLLVTDDRTITGINAWIKPMKFFLSVAIYLWTFGWLLHYVKSTINKAFISWGILICMAVENIAIVLQAARGVSSHFNFQTYFDAMVFATMGVFIGINTFLIACTLILFCSKGVSHSSNNMLLAWRVGLFLLLIGGVSGGLMISQFAHTYGAPDGGPGLPFLSWSTVAGDIRPAHFITLHGLQAIPLFAWFVSSKTSRPNLALLSFIVLYVAVCIWLHMQALSGQPLIAL
jgi:hypothetical protein